MKCLNGLVTCGMDIKDFAKLLVEKKDLHQQSVYAEFNGIKVIADRYSTIKSVLDDFSKQNEERRVKYHNSPEYKELVKISAINSKKTTETLREKIEQLKTLDFVNLVLVLDWLCEVQPFTDTIGNDDMCAEIVDIFNEHEYSANVNVGNYYDGNDKDNVALYIIGQALDCLQSIGAIHPVVIGFTEQWKNKFLI